jgi:hypothetical protein
MAISWNEAEGAVIALRGLYNQNAFDVLKENGKHLFDKHTNKQDALAGAQEQGGEQGYFKKLVTVNVDKAQYNAWAERERQGLTSKASKYLRTKGIDGLIRSKDFKPKHAGSMDATSPLGEDDYIRLVYAILRQEPQWYCRSDARPNDRFVLLAHVPHAFVGRAVEGDGTKHKDADWAVMVIRARPQPTGIVTVFPAAGWYADRLTDLN